MIKYLRRLIFRAYLLFPSLNPNAPKGIIRNAREWLSEAISTSTNDPRYPPDGWYRDADPAQLVSVRLPIYVGEDTTTKPYSIGKVFFTGPTGLFMIRNGRILGSDATVMSPDGRIFSEFTYRTGGAGAFKMPKPRRYSAISRLQGTFVTILYPSSIFGYYHWIAESLPRLRFVSGFIDSLDGVLVPAKLPEYIKESLLAFGFHESQMISLEAEKQYQCDQLLVPQFCAGLNYPEWVGDFLKSFLVENGVLMPALPYRKIFISREDATHRRIVNESDVRTRLSDIGFEVVLLTGMGFAEQVKLFFEADTIIAPHGAGLVNVLFSQSGVKVFELMPASHIPPQMYAITSQIGGEYFYTAGNTAGNNVRRGAIDSDFVLPPSTLDAIVAILASR